MRLIGQTAINMVVAVFAGFVGAFPGTVLLMWLVALVNEHVFAGIRPAGYWDLFLIDWILSYVVAGLIIAVKDDS